MKTLADLRADKPTGRPERSMTLCLKPELVAEAQALTIELGNLPAAPSPDADDAEPTGPPQKLGDPSLVAARTRGAAVSARLEEVLEEMAEHEGELRVRANLSDGEWRRWVNEHPTREEGDPGYDRDQRVSSGMCNADDLIDKLSEFVHQWNGEPLTPQDWTEIFEPVVGSGDLSDMARHVVGLYEARLDFPQWRSGLSASLKRFNDYSSPASSASPTSDSTAGSPGRSTAATTKTGAK